MKKTAIALLSVASFFALPAHAEIDPDYICQKGYELATDDNGNYACVRPEDLADLEQQSDLKAPACSYKTINDITAQQTDCFQSLNEAKDQCSEAAINDALKKAKKQGDVLQEKIRAGLKKGDKGYQDVCASIIALNKDIASRTSRLLNSCEASKKNCVNQCAESSAFFERMLSAPTQGRENCNPEYQKASARMVDAHNKCIGFEANADKMAKIKQGATVTAKDAETCQDMVAAGTKNSDGDITSALEETPKTGDGAKTVAAGADTAGTPDTKGGNDVNADGSTKGDGTSDPVVGGAADPSTSDDDKAQAKKSGPNQNEIGSLMGAASSLLSAFMQKSEPQQVQPMQLDAADCRRPENMSSMVCRCQANWTPDCNGTTASSEGFASNALPGVGGSQLNKENNGTKLQLGPDQPVFEIPRKNDTGGGGGGGGMYGGGGGFSPPPANFTPDNNKGRSGSSLSADILNGTHGGGMMGGMRGSAGAMRPALRQGRGNSDPEDLPGYGLGKKDDRPDFNSFMPPGAGAVGGEAPVRGISGMVGSQLQEGMHPSSTDIFKAVSNRYRQLEVTLYADK